MGIEFTDFGPDYICATLPVDHRTIQPMGILHGGASVVLAEIWPGLIEASVKATIQSEGAASIRDRVQVRLLADALARLPASRAGERPADQHCRLCAHPARPGRRAGAR